MRCSEAKSRLSHSVALDDRELLKHLKRCPKCAEEARLSGVMRSILGAASVDDREGMMPMAEARAMIEAASRISATSHRNGLRKVRQEKTRSVSVRRPLVGFGVAIAVAALIVMVLTPFEDEQIIGYEVNVAGIQRELVEDNTMLCDLLYKLGLDDADVDILGCDTTCRVQVLYLKSRDEVQLVLAAMSEINSGDLTTNVRTIRSTSSGTFLDRSNEDIL